MKGDIVILSVFILIVCALPVVAMNNCIPPSGRDWVLNSTNTSVVCDDGTPIDLGAYSLILTENATANFTSGTNLTAGNITVQNVNQSLVFDGSTTNATLYLSDGNVTFKQGSNLTGTQNISGGHLILLNVPMSGALFFISGSATANMTNASGAPNISLYDQASLNATASAFGTIASNPGGQQSITISRSTISIMMASGDGTIFSLTSTNVTETFTARYNVTLQFFQSNNVSASSLNFGTDSTPGSANISGNVSFVLTTPSNFSAGQNLTRLFPAYLVNETSGGVASKTLKLLRMAGDVSSSIWNGTTDSAGYAEPNATFNSSNYGDTLYLHIVNGTAEQSITILNATPINWSIDTVAPNATLAATTQPVYGNTFWFNVTFSNDTIAANYTISNASATWSNGTWTGAELSAANYFLSRSFSGIYLPPGAWNITVWAYDAYGNLNTTFTNVTSEQAIVATLTSDAEQDATIGGSDITFSFNVTVKGAGSQVRAFLALTDGSHTYNSAYAALRNSTSSANVSGSADYAGASSIGLPAISAAVLPSSVTNTSLVTGSVTQATLTLALTPYSGLSAGTYTGSYGFGVFG